MVKKTARDWHRGKDQDSDIPFWYGERANLSLFAGALWLTDTLVFEEFSTTKHRAGRGSSGRADIWFKIRRQQFIGEVKHVRTNAASDNKRLRAGMKEAVKCVREYRQLEAARLAMVFVTVEVLARDKPKVNDRLEKWIEQVQKLKCDALAWTFPKDWRDFQYKKGDRIFPGCALLIKTV